jgi:hypothetical protein
MRRYPPGFPNRLLFEYIISPILIRSLLANGSKSNSPVAPNPICKRPESGIFGKNVTNGPGVPVGPVVPVAPVGPVDPVGPVTPVEPVAPVDPVGPWSERTPTRVVDDD